MTSSVSRRSVAKGLVWTGPVVTIAAVAPQAAATPIVTLSSGRACKDASTTSDCTYLLEFCFTNESNQPVMVEVTGGSAVPEGCGAVAFPSPPPFQVPAAGPTAPGVRCVAVRTSVPTCCANGLGNVTGMYTYQGASGPVNVPILLNYPNLDNCNALNPPIDAPD